MQGYEDNLGEPLRAVKEDVEREWIPKLDAERKLRVEKENWAEELICQLEKERQVREDRFTPEILKVDFAAAQQVRRGEESITPLCHRN